MWKLSSYIVSGNTANAKYQGQTLGNLAAGSTTAQMEKLINKWFLGLDRPTAGGTYRQIAGTAVRRRRHLHRHQARLPRRLLLHGVARPKRRSRTPSAITNMFVVNGDGTYTVKFFNNGQAELRDRRFVPAHQRRRPARSTPACGAMYNNASNELWTAWPRRPTCRSTKWVGSAAACPATARTAYSAIEGGYIYAALGQITGQSTTAFASTTGTTSFTTFVTAYNQGKSIGFASKSTPASSTVVGSHAYAVVGYNASNQTVTLFNPWGTRIRPGDDDLEPDPGATSRTSIARRRL